MGRRGWSSWSEDYQRRDPDNPANQPSRTRALRRKNTRRWCKGKEGREHTIEVTKWAPSGDRPWGCGTNHGVGIHCWHREHCTTCGKWLTWLTLDRCPDHKKGATP